MKLISLDDLKTLLETEYGRKNVTKYSLGEGTEIEGTDKKQLYIYLRYVDHVDFVRSLVSDCLNVKVQFVGQIIAA